MKDKDKPKEPVDLAFVPKHTVLELKDYFMKSWLKLKEIKRNKDEQGFTLVELAIVIVIIGLLVGGVLQGNELIKSSRINSAVSKVQGYNGAVNTFRGKYDALPGDIPNPAKYGLNTAKNSTTVNVCPGGWVGVVPSAIAGGGGNGNNIIGVLNGQGCNGNGLGGFEPVTQGSNWSGEAQNFFVHLSNSQFIQEGFNQDPTTNSGNMSVEIAYPRMPVGVGMVVMSDGGSTNWVLGTRGLLTSNGSIVGNNLSPMEASSIDAKMDDGNPLTGLAQAVSAYGNPAGTFTAATPSATNCVNTSSAYNNGSVYENSKLCTLKILGNF